MTPASNITNMAVSLQVSTGCGLELLYTSVKNQIRSQYDALVCCLHWNMVHSGFKCVGLGEEASGQKSELLPSAWNEGTCDVYTLRYQPIEGTDFYLLKVIRMDDTLLVHLLREKDERVSNLSLETSEYVEVDNLGDFNRMFKNIDKLQQEFKSELMDKLKETNSTSRQSPRDTPSQQSTRSQEDDTDPLRIPRRQPNQDGRPDWGQPRNPFVVGEGDLDPFSRAPPGMLMDPTRSGFPQPGYPGGYRGGLGMPGRLPRGAVPPGARFDPVGPPNPDGGLPNPQGRYRGEPDPDHEPPPGFDDMFM
ncbi:proteasome inhibitor PI31 subunit-like [Acanthaster planci]|uniref:Proteasome inhibitor PI31 subunit n=1 Tax=Acanthaster planci TaxID=133434 RepID=A0A8B7ZE71_ACAPL|nr:proteasome inhibitor PI31 subunit-like [Acanthaster planci]